MSLNGAAPSTIAGNIGIMHSTWNSERQVWLKRVREVIQFVYATSTKETTNSKNPWSHSTHIPKLTQIHDNLGANYTSALFAKREFFTFEPANKNENTAEKRKAIQAYLATKHDLNSFIEVMNACANDLIQTGNCFARVDYVREINNSEDGETVIYEGPRVTRISPYDIVFDHAAANFAATPKIVRSVMTRGELLRKVEESPEGDYDLTEVQRAKTFYADVAGWKDSEINKYIQDLHDGFSGSASFFRCGKCEILDFIGDIYDEVTGTLHKDMIISVLDRRFVVRMKQRKDYQGTGYIYHAGWRKRPDNLWAQGPLDNIAGMQYLINHLENARADAFDQMLTPDRVHVGNVEIENDGPVTNYYIDDAQGSVSNLAPDATVLQADNQIQLKEAQMEAYAGAPREALGIRSPGEKTAFEVGQLATAASRLFQVKIEQMEREFVEPIINGELEVSVNNLNVKDVASILDDDFGVQAFLDVTVDDLTAKGKLKARGASHYAKRQQLVQELQQFGAVLAADQAMAIHFPAKARAEAWNDALGFDKYELYKPFGAIAEQLEAKELMSAATDESDKTEAASGAVTDAENATSGIPTPAPQ